MAGLLPFGFGIGLFIVFIVSLLVLSFFLWIAGVLVVGGKRARFTDAVIIAFVGTVASTAVSLLVPLLGFVLAFVIWLVLIRHFYETGWLGSFAVAIVAIIIMAVLAFVLGAAVFLPRFL